LVASVSKLLPPVISLPVSKVSSVVAGYVLISSIDDICLSCRISPLIPQAVIISLSPSITNSSSLFEAFPIFLLRRLLDNVLI
jgi:hypothetical protein